MRKNKLTWTTNNAGVEADAGVRRLVREDLGVVFQPIVDLSNGAVFAFEALARCKHPDYTSPLHLFEAAVKEDACGRLGRMIREVAFATSGDVPLFVNVHPQELASRWLVQPDDPICFHTREVFLEITEGSTLSHFDLCVGVLKELARRTSAKIVVDDFGAGYSNLERVVDLSPAFVKLDLALTRDIHKHASKQTVVRHMVAMCRDLGARVVAEGVETVDELRCVRDLGAAFAQGYLLARPAATPPQPAWPLSPPKPAVPRPTSPSARITVPASKRTRSSSPPRRA